MIIWVDFFDDLGSHTDARKPASAFQRSPVAGGNIMRSKIWIDLAIARPQSIIFTLKRGESNQAYTTARMHIYGCTLLHTEQTWHPKAARGVSFPERDWIFKLEAMNRYGLWQVGASNLGKVRSKAWSINGVWWTNTWLHVYVCILACETRPWKAHGGGIRLVKVQAAGSCMARQIPTRYNHISNQFCGA